MTIAFLRRTAIVTAISGVMALPSGCVGAGPGGASDYGYDASVGIGADYYEPYGYDYGGWDSGYAVGPYRDYDHRGDHGRGNPGPHSYRSAPTSRPMPSIPSGPRFGGGRR